jgi:hypothetical protein
VRDQVSQPYKTTGKIIVLYIIILKLLARRRDDKKRAEVNGSGHSPNLIVLTAKRESQKHITFMTFTV